MSALLEAAEFHERMAKSARQFAEWTPIKELAEVQLLDAWKHDRWATAIREADGDDRLLRACAIVGPDCCAKYPYCEHQQKKIEELNQRTTP